MKASDDFQVFVKPVGAHCNLACKYCYYLEKASIYPHDHNYRMNGQVLENYILQHIQASAGPDIFFSWHGGEPTLAGLSYFRLITSIQHKYCPPNAHIINGLQTNGTMLNDEWCRFFADEKFVVGISIDGPEDLNSLYRHSAKGHSVYSQTLRGFQLLKWYGIPCEILCVVNAHNVQEPIRIYNFFKKLGAQYITFIPLVEKQLSANRLVSEDTVPAKAYGEFLVAVFEEWKSSDIGKIKIQLVEEALRSAFDQEHALCILKKTCGRVPVVEQNGDFYSCDHYVDLDHLVGNIMQTPLVELLESEQQRQFGQSKFDSLPDQCLRCEVLGMCNGACPKDRFITTSDGQEGLNYLCEGYRLFFNHCKPFAEAIVEVASKQL